VRDYVGYGSRPPAGTWPNGATVALNVVLNIEEGAERSYSEDGVNEGLGEVSRAVGDVRDLATESVYEYGSRAGIHRLLRIVDERNIPITAFAAARALEASPEIGPALSQSGHEVSAHGFRWTESWTLSEELEREEIRRAVETIERLTGERPPGWYSRWMRNERTRRLLVEHGGFLYDSDAYNDDIPYYVDVAGTAHLVVPYTLTYNDAHYTYGHYASPRDFFAYCVAALDQLATERDAPRLLSVGLHSRISGQAARAHAVAEFLDVAMERPDVWIATRRQIAEFWLDEHPPDDAPHRPADMARGVST
jgi:peptidoglycan/xylan/chitin deacetylase (PgdA/CDA1 family)